MTITDKTLSVSVWDAIKTTITSANIKVGGTAVTVQATHADITDGSGSSRKHFVIVNPIEVDETKDKFGSNQGKKFINILIDCIDNKTSAIDYIADEVTYALSEANIQGIDLVGVTSSYAFTNPNLIKYHEKNLVFTYTRE
jgi:hypothetical protein